MYMIGRRVKRRADPRFMRGQGQYIADLRLPGMLHAAFIRSVYAHARVMNVDTSAAWQMHGVVAIYNPLDVAFPYLPFLFPHPALDTVTQQPLSREAAHVGEPVVMVIEGSRYHAEDACEAVEVTYEPLDAAAPIQAAMAENASLTHSWMTSNLAARFQQNAGDAAGALASDAGTRSKPGRRRGGCPSTFPCRNYADSDHTIPYEKPDRCCSEATQQPSAAGGIVSSAEPGILRMLSIESGHGIRSALTPTKGYCLAKRRTR
jgi:xanthine dehydrogenase molybdopterin-binding subunit B